MTDDNRSSQNEFSISNLKRNLDQPQAKKVNNKHFALILIKSSRDKDAIETRMSCAFLKIYGKFGVRTEGLYNLSFRIPEKRRDVGRIIRKFRENSAW